MFKDDLTHFVGIGVGEDLSKIGSNYYCLAVIKNIKHVINLGQFARRWDVIKNGIISLEQIASEVLNEKFNKNSLVICYR